MYPVKPGHSAEIHSTAASHRQLVGQQAASSHGLADRESSLSSSSNCFESFFGACANFFINLFRCIFCCFRYDQEDRGEDPAASDLGPVVQSNNRPPPIPPRPKSWMKAPPIPDKPGRKALPPQEAPALSQESSDQSLATPFLNIYRTDARAWLNDNFMEESFKHLEFPYELRTVVRVSGNGSKITSSVVSASCDQAFRSDGLESNFKEIDQLLKTKNIRLQPQKTKIAIVICVTKQQPNGTFDSTHRTYAALLEIKAERSLSKDGAVIWTDPDPEKFNIVQNITEPDTQKGLKSETDITKLINVALNVIPL